MKKWFIVGAIIVAYVAIIWLVRTNSIAMTAARWITGISLAVFALDWLVGQIAGLFSDKLQEWCSAAILPIVAFLCALFPLFLAVTIQ